MGIGIRCLIGTVFLVSSFSKVAGRGAFAAFTTSIRDMGLLPRALVRPAAWAVVIAEFAVWALLAVPAPVPAAVGFVIALGLLVAFAIGITAVVRRGVRAPCRCFGVSATPLGPRHVVRNILLAVASALGAVAVFSTGALQVAGVAVAVPCGLLLGGLTVALDDLFVLFQPVRTAPAAARGLR
ncbi:hypothetical protein LRS74_27550 [Streptomyces sp. LX-29]|uniref:MauE/DoxX family redox-associated membrane protein n=1 Tax=Streptomyces sp. LX-29 TaxID=2900152 RepID=UPI00240DEBD8|nr:MauE/DoxX family redox-associated membrane protein [Streptomyces sp. LX-29]WFB10374.1 hypothetical protein LRS74_27550 [Streptomyces sp. LX-29]